MVPADVYEFSSKCNVQGIFLIWITYFSVDCTSAQLVTKLDRSMMSSLKPKIEYANEGWPLTVFHIDRELKFVVEKKLWSHCLYYSDFSFTVEYADSLTFFSIFSPLQYLHSEGVEILYVTQGIFSDYLQTNSTITTNILVHLHIGVKMRKSRTELMKTGSVDFRYETNGNWRSMGS